MKVIAHIETPFREKFGVPRQAGLVDYEARVVFEPEYRVAEAVRGLEEFEYIWLIWQFHLNNEECGMRNDELKDAPANSSFLIPHSTFKATVRPPRLGGNRRVGVFATRSPFRPNAIGLSSVRLLRIEPGPVLVVSGADLVDGTPIFDIKPYIPYADSHPDARSGFATEAPERLKVVVPQDIAHRLPQALLQPLVDTIAQDPRPHYQQDPDRQYALLFDSYEVRFCVDGGTATILTVTEKSKSLKV